MKYLFISLFILGSVIAKGNALQEDIIQLDRAFIPAWYFASEHQFEQATVANSILQYEWQNFKAKYQDLVQTDDLWQEAIGRIDAWIYQAQCDLEDKEMELAFIHFDHAKYEMIHFKRTFGLSYLLDDLYDFHEHAAWIEEIIMDDLLCLFEWRDVQDKVVQTVNHWTKIYPLDEVRTAWINNPNLKQVFSDQCQTVDRHLSTLQRTLEKADQCLAQEVVGSFEDQVMLTIIALGNFDFQSFKL